MRVIPYFRWIEPDLKERECPICHENVGKSEKAPLRHIRAKHPEQERDL